MKYLFTNASSSRIGDINAVVVRSAVLRQKRRRAPEKGVLWI